jgi:hypothetical protein
MPAPLSIPLLASIFDAFMQRYEQWSAPLRSHFEENWPRRNRDGYTTEQFVQEQKDLQSILFQTRDPYLEFERILDQVCPNYLNALPDERGEVRELVSARAKLSNLMRGYASGLTKKINSPADHEKVLNALAAISMENCRTDFRDTWIVLANLFVRAEEVGIDPKHYFQCVAQLSSDQPAIGGSVSLKEALCSFDTYSIVAERRRIGKPY